MSELALALKVHLLRYRRREAEPSGGKTATTQVPDVKKSPKALSPTQVAHAPLRDV